MRQASADFVKRNAYYDPAASIANVVERNLYKWIKITYYLCKLKVISIQPWKNSC